MRQVVLILVLMISMHTAQAATNPAEKLLALVKLAPEKVTRDKIIALLGNPEKVEESKKGSKWVYNYNDTKLTLQWSKRSAAVEEFSFTCRNAKICPFDKKKECKLKEGSMSMQQAVTLLGPPHDMVVKSNKQIMFYNYEGNTLRLFFRNRTLVDYTLLLGQKTATLEKK